MFKKILAAILVLTVAFAVALPATAAGYNEYPTIYVLGARVTNLYSADGTKIFPTEDVDAAELIKEVIKPCLEKAAAGVVTNDYTQLAQELHPVIIKIFGDIALDGSGEVPEGDYTERPYNYYLPKKTSGYGTHDYEMSYDWRESPLDTAETLKKYIEEVKAVTGESKVNLLGRCYGANVVQAYLTKYPEHALANVDDVAYLSASVEGIDALGSLFSGDIEFNDEAVDNFADYFLENKDIIEDETLKALVTTTIDLLNYTKALGLTGDALEAFVSNVKTDVFPYILKDAFAGYVSYWSMVPAEQYEKARDFIFAGAEEEYAGFIKKIDDYHYNVQLKIEETLKELDSKGIDFYMLSKYNFPDMPVHENAAYQSDGYTLVERQSFGATCAKYGEVLSDKYISSLADTKYLSPDHKIDASTCLFPETSYFIKDMYHDTFPYAINSFALRLMNNEATVSGGEYKQYYRYDGTNELKEIEGLDEDAAKQEEPKQLIFIRFFTAILNFFTKLFKGELSFDGLFG